MDVFAWMTNSVTVAAYTGPDSTGAPTYGAQKVLPARIEASNKLVRSKDGTEVASSHVIYTNVSQIGILDAIWLPSDNAADPTVAKYPISTAQAYDYDGNFVYFKATI